MKTTRNRNRWNLRRLAMLGALSLGMVVLPGAVSHAEAHGPHGKGYKKAHKWEHKSAYHAAYGHGHRHFAPVYVNYYRPRVIRPVAFYLRTPHVVLHGPRVDARVVYYPGNAPLYAPGHCPSDVHYHPYTQDDDYVDVDVHGKHARVNVRVGF
jgi:hypothetical protein